MNTFKNLFLFNKNPKNNREISNKVLDHYEEIAKIVKEARIQKNLSIKELSKISKIPEQTINSIENNNINIRPKYPFIRSILIKLEECLGLKKSTLVKLAIRERETFKSEKPDFLVSKFDLINGYFGLVFSLLFSIEFIVCSGIFEINDKS